MSVFFNGMTIIQPQAVSKIDDSAMQNTNIGVGKTLGIIGLAEGGKPKTALTFTDPARAAEVLISGDLLEAVRGAFGPSAQMSGASKIIAVNCKPLTQATRMLKKSDDNIMQLVAVPYGLTGNQIKTKLENGTAAGTKKITIAYEDEIYTKDSIGRGLLNIQYVGQNETATLTINATELTITAGAGESITASFATYSTIQKLYDLLATKAYLETTLIADNPDHPTAGSLDNATAVNIKASSYTISACLQAVVDWLNSGAQPWVTAVRQEGVGDLPDNDTSYVYLSGGTSPVADADDWQDAIDVLKVEDVQYVVPATSDAATHAMVDTHVQYMSKRKFERRAIVGGAVGERTTIGDVSAVTTRAKNLNSDRTQLVFPGIYDYNSQGVLTLYPPYLVAARVAGMWAGSDYGVPLTHKYLTAQGMEYNLLSEEIDALILGGVCAIENVRGRGYRIVKSVTTWLANSKYNRVEFSSGDALDKVVRDVREAVEEGVIGEKNTAALLARALAIADTKLKQAADAELIVGDAVNPAYKNLSAYMSGDMIAMNFQCSPVIPNNYTTITAYAVVFSSSAAV